MTITVEDGTGITGADSYAAVATADAYFVGRRLFSAAWNVATTSDKEVALKQASMLLDAEFTWAGTEKVSATQGLAWPFTDATDKYGNDITGVPKEVVIATYEVAFYLLAQDRMVDQQGTGLTSLQVDTVKLTFDKKEMPRTFPPHVTRLLTGLGYAVKSTAVRNVKLNRV